MLAARLYGKEDIRLEEVSRPDITENEILLKVQSSFVCGTDVRMYKNGHPNATPDSPLILGHELSGVIEGVGKNVTCYKEGNRVAVAPNMGCGICDLCIGGNTHLCPDYKALGISLGGAFAEYARIPEAAIRQGNVIELKENVTYKEGALVEPLSCVYNAFERSNIRPGDYVLVIGAGPIGIMHAKLAKAAGAAKVIINDLVEARLELCRKIDPAFMVVSGNNIKEQIMDETGGKGVDVYITACPAAAAQEASLSMMAVNGRVIFFGGLPKGTKVTLDTNLIHYKQLIISGTTRASLRQYRKTLDLVAAGEIEVQDLVSGSYVLADFHKAIDNASRGIGLKNEIVFE